MQGFKMIIHWNQPFNPNLSGHSNFIGRWQKLIVVNVSQKGYSLNDRVLDSMVNRFAQINLE